MSGRDEHETIRKYLLGQLTGPESDQFEERFFADDRLFEELQAGEEELMDDFLTNDLSQADLAMFHQNFMVGPERQRQLRLSKAWREYARANSFDAEPKPRRLIGLTQLFSSYPFRVAAFAAVLVIAAVGTWRIFFFQSEVDKGLIALNSAYRQQRPLESRITKFDYAPFVTTRGSDSEVTDQNELNRAELLLLEALKNKPTPAIRHALGKVYLSKKDFDRAIQQFDEALKGDGSNALIYTDLGTAWLEKGKRSLELSKGSSSPSELGQGREEIGRSLETLNKALSLDGELLEALFNKALAEQYMTLYEQAAEDWKLYLQRDSTSRWADEAQRNLKLLEARKNRSSGIKGQLLDEFLKAYATRNEDGAWAALRLSEGRTGNAIVHALLDDFFSLEAVGKNSEAQVKLEILTYAGLVQARRVNDRFISDLVKFYRLAGSKQRDVLATARGTMRVAIGFYDKSQWKQSILLFSEAQRLFQLAGDDLEALFVQAWIGYCHLRIPDPRNSIRIFERLSDSFQKRSYRSLYAQSLLALADAQGALNEFSNMLEYTAKAQIVSEQIEDYASLIRSFQAQTSVLLIVGSYGESLASAFRAINLAETLPPDAKVTWPFYHEASIGFYFLGMPSVAVQFENEAVRLAQGSKLWLQLSRSYDRLAVIHQHLQHYDEALKNSEYARAEGLRLPDEKARTNILAHSALVSGQLYRDLGQFQRALVYYDQAIELYAKLEIDIYQYQSRKGKLLTLIDLGDDAAVEAELDSVIFWFEQNRAKINEESYRNKFFDTGQNAYDVAVDFYYTRKKDKAKAFEYAERYRARSLLDLKSAGAQIIDGPESPELKLSSSTLSLTLPQIQQQLQPEVQLLQYSVLEDKVIVWVVTGNQLEGRHTDIRRAELDEKVRRFSTILSRPGSHGNQEVENLARELYAILLKPVEGHLESSKQLCVIPDDSIAFIPFAALISPSSNKHLVEDFTIQTAPSATLFIHSSAQPAPRGKVESERLLIVGNPRFDRDDFGSLPDLPGAEREAIEIARFYDATPLVGDAAVASRVKPALSEADIIHLATHAIPDERSHLLSKLLLSKDRSKKRSTHHASSEFLQASEIYGIKFSRTRLVVLSACQTGVERTYRGEGAIGLARPFIAAGVPLVIASLWSVESESTADLMITFHKYRKKENFSAVQALRLAQLDILHNRQPGSPMDYGWAAFVAIGGHTKF